MSWSALWLQEQLRRALWAIGVLVTLAAAALWLYGCTPAPKAPSAVDFGLAAACHEAIDRLIASSTTCGEAEKAINADPACRAIAPDGLSLACKGAL